MTKFLWNFFHWELDKQLYISLWCYDIWHPSLFREIEPVLPNLEMMELNFDKCVFVKDNSGLKSVNYELIALPTERL